MRKLVLVANNNYENIERKWKNLEKSSKGTGERFREQRSSPEITSKSQVTNKKSPRSPSISERTNVMAKGSIEDNYRKMILKTLKSRPIR
jgi:hypothetical protein